MTDIALFLNESPVHRVVQENSGFTIHPCSDSPSDLANFQHLAQSALDYSGNDYVVKEVRDRTTKLIEQVFFSPTE